MTSCGPGPHSNGERKTNGPQVPRHQDRLRLTFKVTAQGIGVVP